jgi:hypothetical protein
VALRVHRYELRNLSDPTSSTPPTTLDGTQTDYPMTTEDPSEEDDAKGTVTTTPAGPPTELEHLQAELKAQTKLIRSLQRRLAKEDKANARREVTRRRQKRFQENQRKKMNALEEVQWDIHKKTLELEKQNRRLVSEKAVEEEIRKQLERDFPGYTATRKTYKAEWYKSKLEEFRKDMGCEIVVLRTTPKARSVFEVVEDLHELQFSWIPKLKMFKPGMQHVSVTKVEYILNEELHARFKETKAMFAAQGRDTKEVILFHGTEHKKVDTYPPPHFKVVSYI